MKYGKSKILIFPNLLISEAWGASFIINKDQYTTDSTHSTESTNIKDIHGNPDLLVMSSCIFLLQIGTLIDNR